MVNDSGAIYPIAILAGGQSRRMGQDKAGLVWQGRTLLGHMVHVAAQVAAEVLIVGGAKAMDESASPSLSPSPLAVRAAGTIVRFASDDQPGLGPLGGLATALRQHASVLVLACDLPLVTPDGVKWLMSLGAESAAEFPAGGPADDGVITTHGGQLEPLFAVYRASCLPIIERQLASGRRSMRTLVAAGRFGLVEAPAWVAAQLVNVNTPEDWERLQPPLAR